MSTKPHPLKSVCLCAIQNGSDPKAAAKVNGVSWPTMRVWMSRWRKSGEVSALAPTQPISILAPSIPHAGVLRSIYIAAGDRNLTGGAVFSNGGVWANIGQTLRDPRERITDRDYKRKQMGGRVVLLGWWIDVATPDTDIHQRLKSDSRVTWVKGTNTEEFLFMDDDGTGSTIRKKVGSIISTMNPARTIYMVTPFL